jgi:hypothetical protein
MIRFILSQSFQHRLLTGLRHCITRIIIIKVLAIAPVSLAAFGTTVPVPVRSAGISSAVLVTRTWSSALAFLSALKGMKLCLQKAILDRKNYPF